jgi:hypothetical protein
MSPPPRLPADWPVFTVARRSVVERWRKSMRAKETGVRHTPNALAMVKDARKGRLSRRMLMGIGIGASLLALFSAAAFAQLIDTQVVTQHATDYQGASSTDPNYPTPSTATFAPVTLTSSDLVSGDCMVTGASNPGTYTGTGISNAGPTFVSVDANNTGTACAAGWFAEEFTFHPASTLVAESLKLQITTTYAGEVGGVATEETYSCTVTEAVTAGSTSSNEGVLIVDVTYGATGYPSGGVSSLDILLE